MSLSPISVTSDDDDNFDEWRSLPVRGGAASPTAVASTASSLSPTSPRAAMSSRSVSSSSSSAPPTSRTMSPLQASLLQSPPLTFASMETEVTPASSRRASGVLHVPLSLSRPPPVPSLNTDADSSGGGGLSRRPRANANISVGELPAALLHAPKNVLVVSEMTGVLTDSSAASSASTFSNRENPVTTPQRPDAASDVRASTRPSSASTGLGLRSGVLSTSGARQRLAASAMATSAIRPKPHAWAAKPGISGRLLVNGDDDGSGGLRVFSERVSFSNSRPSVKTRWDPSDEASQYFGFGSRATDTDGDEDNVLEMHGASWDNVETALFLGKPSESAGAALSTLPAFASLRVLSLSNCGLSPELVSRLPALPCLEACDFSHNVLTGLGRVPDDITANHLASLLSSDSAAAAAPGAPDAAGGLRWLRFAPRLKALSLSHCALDAVPSLVWLARPGCALERLDLSSNRIVAPEGLNVVSSTLAVLDLGSNCIASFGFEGVRLLGSLSRLAHLVLQSNPVVSTAISPSTYRAAVIDLIPSLLSLDGVETPPSVIRTRQAQTETALRPAETALKARLRREQSAADEARKREALRLSSVSSMPHKYRAGPKREEAEEQEPSRPPWRPTSDTHVPTSFSASSPFTLPAAKSATPGEASRSQRLRMSTLSRPTRPHVPSTPQHVPDADVRASPVKSPRSGAARPSRRLGPVALLAQDLSGSMSLVEPDDIASFEEQQERLVLVYLSATKAILFGVEPWRIEVFGGGSVDAAAQTAARLVATTLQRLRDIVGVHLGGCDLADLAERASQEPAPTPRGLLRAEVQRELAAASAAGLSDREAAAILSVLTARKALELVSHVLLSHAAVTRRLVAAGASHVELHERVAAVKSDIDDVCADLSASACGTLSAAFLAARK